LAWWDELLASLDLYGRLRYSRLPPVIRRGVHRLEDSGGVHSSNEPTRPGEGTPVSKPLMCRAPLLDSQPSLASPLRVPVSFEINSSPKKGGRVVFGFKPDPLRGGLNLTI
jgi:hypothetical protein